MGDVSQSENTLQRPLGHKVMMQLLWKQDEVMCIQGWDTIRRWFDQNDEWLTDSGWGSGFEITNTWEKHVIMIPKLSRRSAFKCSTADDICLIHRKIIRSQEYWNTSSRRDDASYQSWSAQCSLTSKGQIASNKRALFFRRWHCLDDTLSGVFLWFGKCYWRFKEEFNLHDISP